MTAHMLEHLALTLVLGPALAAGAAGRLRVPPWFGLVQFAVLVAVLHLPVVWDATHAHPLLWLAADVATVASALLFWWPALAKSLPLRLCGALNFLKANHRGKTWLMPNTSWCFTKDSGR